MTYYTEVCNLNKQHKKGKNLYKRSFIIYFVKASFPYINFNTTNEGLPGVLGNKGTWQL